MGNYFDEPVLLIKTAWEAKACRGFLSPQCRHAADDHQHASIRLMNSAKRIGISCRRTGAQYGHYYRMMLTDIDHTLKTLKKRFPAYVGLGYELSGFAWFQGWNDGGDLKWAKSMPQT